MVAPVAAKIEPVAEIECVPVQTVELDAKVPIVEAVDNTKQGWTHEQRKDKKVNNARAPSGRGSARGGEGGRGDTGRGRAGRVEVRPGRHSELKATPAVQSPDLVTDPVQTVVAEGEKADASAAASVSAPTLVPATEAAVVEDTSKQSRRRDRHRGRGNRGDGKRSAKDSLPHDESSSRPAERTLRHGQNRLFNNATRDIADKPAAGDAAVAGSNGNGKKALVDMKDGVDNVR